MPMPYLHGRLWLGTNDVKSDRRQSEWDDHGEAYARTYDGPHVRCTLSLPPGMFVLSYYNINKDGQHGSNRFRDYRVTLRDHVKNDLDDEDATFAGEPELSTTRTNCFCGGGVYSSWIVKGPSILTLEVNRNYSFNTIIAGILLDQIDELPAPYLEAWEDYNDPEKRALFYRNHIASSITASKDYLPIAQSLEHLRILEISNPTEFVKLQRKAYQMLAKALQVKAASKDPWALQAYRECLYHLNLFDDWEGLVKAEFGKTPREIEKSIRMQQDIQGNGHGREMVERYCGYQPIQLKQGTPPPQNQLSSFK